MHNTHCPLISKELYTIVQTHKDTIQEIFDYERDFNIDYFGFKTLERAYLMKINDKIVERPQHMWMRVALCIHKDNISKVKETYDAMSLKYFTHATPTLFIAVPRFQIYGETTLSTPATLIYITSCVIKYPQHRNNTVAFPIGSTDSTVTTTNIMDMHSNTPCPL